MVIDEHRRWHRIPMKASPVDGCVPDGRLSWSARRRYPLIATFLLVIFGMSTTTLGAHLVGEHAWALPHDLWRTLVAADRLRQFDFAHLYTQPTALVTFPGAALILLPIAVVVNATGLGFGFQTAQNPFPGAWLVAGPYEIMLSALALFAADAVAERLGAGLPKRALLAAAGAIALWNVSIWWGHPEDAVAIGMLLYGVLALSNSRHSRSAWLIGAAVAVQPLVLLGLPVVLAVLERRRLAGFLLRAAIPGTVLLGAAAAANWQATLTAVTSQPNFPSRNHPTPWTSLAPRLGDGAVAAGPARALAVLLAAGCAVVVARRWRSRQQIVSWTPEALEEVLWWLAVTLAFRCVFESVMVSYYIWPVLAAALVAASRNWSRLIATSMAASILTLGSQAPWRGPWIWWGSVMLGLGVLLYASVPRARGTTGPNKPTKDADRLFSS